MPTSGRPSLLASTHAGAAGKLDTARSSCLQRSQFIEETVELSFFLPGIISLFIMCVGIIRNNSLVGGRARAESNPGHRARHALLQMAAECVSPSATRAGRQAGSLKKQLTAAAAEHGHGVTQIEHVRQRYTIASAHCAQRVSLPSAELELMIRVSPRLRIFGGRAVRVTPRISRILADMRPQEDASAIADTARCPGRPVWHFKGHRERPM